MGEMRSWLLDTLKDEKAPLVCKDLGLINADRVTTRRITIYPIDHSSPSQLILSPSRAHSPIGLISRMRCKRPADGTGNQGKDIDAEGFGKRRA